MSSRIRVGQTDTSKGITIQWEGHTPEEVAEAINRLGKLPMAALLQPVRKSASNIQRLSRQYAPRRTGALQVGLIVGKKERSSHPGKVVYQVTFSREMNEVFAKTSKAGKRAYYPSSMEYGFRLKDGRRYAGKYYLRNAAVGLMDQHQQVVIDAMWAKLQKLWEKQQKGGGA